MELAGPEPEILTLGMLSFQHITLGQRAPPTRRHITDNKDWTLMDDQGLEGETEAQSPSPCSF